LIVLGLDTCLDACSVAVRDEVRLLAAISEPMKRGHQERLAVMAQAAMAEAGTGFAALDRVGVTVGPGSFTGLRVGLAFAKGLGVALDRSVVGVGVLEALALDAGDEFVAAVIDARRDQIYLQVFDRGRALMAPDVLPVEIAGARLAELWTGGPAVLTGPGAALLAGILPQAGLVERAAPDPVTVARLAAEARPPFPTPRPLYLRAPDARVAGS
jgi:tRNA threonylcarbamoyladenosine biosynthesis protein TsaB